VTQAWSSTGLATYEVPDTVDLEEITEIEVFGPSVSTVLAAPLNTLMGFYLGSLGEGYGADQENLRCMYLDDVHVEAQGGGIRATVLDTGVDPNHPFLANNLEIDGTTPLGLPFEQEPRPPDAEAFGHGTHVAGCILQVAPKATIVPYKVLDSYGVGTDFDLAVALLRALETEVDLVNMSLMLEGVSPVIEELLTDLDAAGIAILAAAGNDGGTAEYPASDAHAYAVAASWAPSKNCQHYLATFSASGDVEFAAVGEDILSAFPLPVGWDMGTDEPTVAYGTGTSMACALATGAAAVVIGSGGVPGPPEDPLYYMRERTLPLLPQGSVLYGVVSPYDVLSLSAP
jgi:subtilisin family serine protease